MAMVYCRSRFSRAGADTVTFFFGTVGFGALVASLVDFLFPGEIGSFIAFCRYRSGCLPCLEV